MINFETLEDKEVVFTEREMKFKALLDEIDIMIGCSCDYEGMLEEREMTIEEIKDIVILSLESDISDDDCDYEGMVEEKEMTIEKYARYVKRVENF